MIYGINCLNLTLQTSLTDHFEYLPKVDTFLCSQLTHNFTLIVYLPQYIWNILT